MPAPNFFGDTKKETSEILKKLTEATNSSSFEATFKNDEGKLALDETPVIKTLVDLVKDGGGSWKLKAKKNKRKRKTTIKSEKNLRILEEDFDKSVDFDEDVVKEIIKNLRKKFGVKSN